MQSSLQSGLCCILPVHLHMVIKHVNVQAASCPHSHAWLMQVQVARDIHQGLQDEYTLRRRMLTERVKVTLDSLLRSNQLQERGTLDEARRVAEQGSARMTAEPLVPFDSIFQACQGAPLL